MSPARIPAHCLNQIRMSTAMLCLTLIICSPEGGPAEAGGQKVTKDKILGMMLLCSFVKSTLVSSLFPSEDQKIL